MKFINGLILLILLAGCSNPHKKFVDKGYTDSLINNIPEAAAEESINKEINFWHSRIDARNPGISNELKYASALIRRFRLFGAMADLTAAEEIVRRVDLMYKGKEAAVYLSLTELALIRHQFKEAHGYLQTAKDLGINSYTGNSLSFDLEYELGNYSAAAFYLSKIKSPADYGYSFRQAKLFHLNGQVDSAVFSMLKAANIAPKGSYLQRVALANAADFSLHNNEIEEATKIFKRCIEIDRNDFHSISGLGVIAMKYDKDYGTAKSLFELVKKRYWLPEPLFKLYQLQQIRNDKNQEKFYAEEFAAIANKDIYGKMFSKYLIEIYTGILNKTNLAETIAREELKNRLTPQTAAWYVWALYSNKKLDQAARIYKKYVAGKPLEGLELYFMGKVMEGLGNAYTAEQYYRAALDNTVDLSPAMIEDLRTRL